MKFLAVIGDPISHSKSPRMHNNAIKALGLDSIYTRYHLRNANSEYSQPSPQQLYQNEYQ